MPGKRAWLLLLGQIMCAEGQFTSLTACWLQLPIGKSWAGLLPPLPSLGVLLPVYKAEGGREQKEQPFREWEMQVCTSFCAPFQAANEMAKERSSLRYTLSLSNWEQCGLGRLCTDAFSGSMAIVPV